MCVCVLVCGVCGCSCVCVCVCEREREREGKDCLKEMLKNVCTLFTFLGFSNTSSYLPIKKKKEMLKNLNSKG